MVEHKDPGANTDEENPPEKKKKVIQEVNSNIIELSDIAIGTTPEDDLIVELTEELIDEAMVGISGATRDSIREGEEVLDLSKIDSEKESRAEKQQKDFVEEKETLESDESTKSTSADEEKLDEHISKELDDFFKIEEAVPEKKAPLISPTERPTERREIAGSLSQGDLMEAVETVIRKVYGDRINKLITETVEKIVREEIKRIKEVLAGKTIE